MIESPPHLADHEADGEPDRDPADHVDGEPPRSVPEREAARHDRGDREAVGDEGGRVVDQALALDQGHEPARQAEAGRDRRRGDGVGRRDDRADHERHGP